MTNIIIIVNLIKYKTIKAVLTMLKVNTVPADHLGALKLILLSSYKHII
jgi:hypothetical protein